ncbi:MAG: choice-of-anchor D domain-containing protein, partial [Pseudomonadales bacterium]|nr:choice-of-anchor D domain-containing protein [Pseudomonadales bacterium]
MKTIKFKMNPIRSAMLGAAMIAANNVAMAAPVSKTLEMVCPFPLIGDQTIIAQISADFPEEVVLADNPVVPPILIETITTVPDKARQGLAFVDATTITGTATSINTIHTVAEDIPNITELTIEPTTVPMNESGPFDVPADGMTPEVAFNESHVGTAFITVDDLVLNLVNLKADGTQAPAPIGEFESDCTIVEGQDTTLTSFEVVGDIVVEDPADIDVDVASVDFGTLQLGQTATETVTITNTGDLDLGINSISIAGADASAFVETNACTTIAGGASCAVDVTYTASEEGSQAANLVIASTDSDEPTVTVALTGTGQVELKPEIEVVGSVDFGTIIEGTTKTETITIENTGGAALTISSVEVTGSEFVEVGSDCATVPAGSSCAVDVMYAAVLGTSTGTLTILSDDEDEGTTTVALTGVGEEEDIEPPCCDIEISLSVEGGSYIAASDATLPLQGDIVSLLNLSTGLFTGDLLLAPTKGKFDLMQGWSQYQATAHVEFESVGITEGSLIDGKLVATSQAYVKLPKVTKTLFGFIDWPIGGGANCR